MSIYKKLCSVQSELKAPKSQFNNFGKYKYRNQEDILEALKPLLAKHELSLTIHDEVFEIQERVYIKAIVTLFDFEGQSITVSAQAREEDSKKGMDASQVSGATSSYARKYALNGMFLIDDTKDADSTQGDPKTSASKPSPKPAVGKTMPTKTVNKDGNIMDKAVNFIKSSTNKTSAFNQVIKKYGDELTEKQKEGLAKFKG